MKALLLEQHETLSASIQDIDVSQLPSGNVVVDIHWSTLNYKDALAITGKGKIIRQFPMVPGIDFSGVVHHSEDPRFHVGQHVLLTGWGVGETHWGGLAEQARVSGEWLTPLPHALSIRQAMIIGTAGFTAMLCVMALEQGGITPESGEIAVTGASGGVGSTAITLLSQLGYSVTAISSKPDSQDYLISLGAKAVLPASDFNQPSRPLEKQRWAGVIDTVGGTVLATLLAQMRYNGTVAACGMASDSQLLTSVMPFILRNVRLQGVESVTVPALKRPAIWQRLQALLPDSFYQQAANEITLDQVLEHANKLINNQITGRTVVKVR
ncbi:MULTISPECIES: MDR family oxidoreductase [Xenorhabdus]|uniref:Acrylyl-CoA reductase (NADPH) n=1 Tax=Xenorhabdus ehlersii TaxID=290111 RepID=A0A2D0IZ13_9GAMM|nr:MULTISPECIES: MDR family oxidoreductase [Xenorhabdus]MBC8948528.1 putative hybrid polyketide-non-ribosomal peptide synthetase [Xenorhabdus sp. TS4]MBC8949085.1 putative hybrid polyketide-non-ribosomal peptide synthetase [Xenorhabdus sp. TS4]PHM27163.1 putative hybrid polyketide-non-ribosomal peptide synthetase [Xenorhabdus ehlersii]RKE92423.1 acrylyl-CoA reductase (NADPH) [Xenorhabdus ehlersii]